MKRIGLEVCSLSAWLHQGVTRAGLSALCIATRHAEAAMGAMPNKTDRNEARGLAQIICTGWYREVHVKSAPCRMARSLLAARRTVLCKLRDNENAVRAVLRESRLKVGSPIHWRSFSPALTVGDAVRFPALVLFIAHSRPTRDSVPCGGY